VVLLLISVLAHAGNEKFNAGKYWLSLPDNAKGMYISGVADGVSLGISKNREIYKPYLRDLKKEKIPKSENPAFQNTSAKY